MELESPPAQLRTRKHRKSRPCDVCRKRRTRCEITQGDTACSVCQTLKRACTFQSGPLAKKRRPPAMDVQSNNSSSTTSVLMPPSGNVSSLPGSGVLSGFVEHVGRTSQYFEELDHVTSSMPSSFVYLNSSLEARRSGKITDKRLPPFTTTTAEVFAVVGPAANPLLKLYFDVVHPAFPVCVTDELNEYFAKLASSDGADQPQKCPEDQALAPLLACILVCAANFADTEPTMPKCPDVTPLREYARTSVIIETRMPRLATVQALMLQVLLLAFKTPAQSIELWSSVGLLVSTAHNIGLHEDPTSWPITAREKLMRRRLWWLLFLCVTLLTHSLGKANLIHFNSYDVPPLTDADFPETSDHITIRAMQLALILHEALETLYEPKCARRLKEEPSLAWELVPPLVLKLETWRSELFALGPSNPAYESPGLRLAYYVIRISLHRVSMKCAPRGDSTEQESATQTMREAVAWVRSLTAVQIRSVWPTQSKYDFAIVSSFMLAMLFTAPTEEQFTIVQGLLHSWRWSLQQHTRSNQELMADALARIDSIYKGDPESLQNLWRQKQSLAVYHYGTFPSHAKTPIEEPLLQDIFPLFPSQQEDPQADLGSNFSPSVAFDVNQYWWQTSTGASLGMPFDLWSSSADQLAEVQIGLLPTGLPSTDVLSVNFT